MSDVFAAAPAELGSEGESMVSWFMSHYGVERDPAIGALVTFVKGWGQPSKEILAAFPKLEELYFAALGFTKQPSPIE